MSDVGDDAPRRMAGTVRWFDVGRGYGFVTVDGLPDGADVLLHANVLRGAGRSSVAEGTRVEVDVLRTPRGFQAVAVHEVASIDPGDAPSDAERAQLDALPLRPGRIRWYDRARGYGFANAFGDTRDAFVHADVVRRSGLSDLGAGEAVAMRLTEGQRGLMVAEILPWESAEPEEGA
ncbi:MAG: cold-shock protein [Paracoccaceae bacterium]